MGSSDSNGLTLIIFSVVYLGFITLMYASISIEGTTYTDFNLNPLSNKCDCGVLSCAEYQLIYGETKTTELCQSQLGKDSSLSMGRFITNFQQLGAWNLLFFSPILIGLGYILLVLLIPSWL